MEKNTKEKKDLYRQYRDAVAKEATAHQKLKEERRKEEEEIAEATKNIHEKYDLKIYDLTQKYRKLHNEGFYLGNQLHRYSLYDREQIAEFLATFLSYVEGEKYIYMEDFNAIPNFLTNDTIIMKAPKEEQIETGIIVIPGTLKENYENGNLIILRNADIKLRGTVEFFASDYSHAPGEATYKFGNFEYLEELAIYLTNYRYINKKEKPSSVSDGDLYNVASEFLATHPDLIARNKDKREMMLQTQDEKTVAICRRLEKK